MMSSLMATLGLDVSPFKRSTMEAQADAKNAGQKIGESLGSFIGNKLGAIGSLATIEELGRKAVEYAAKIENVSRRTGVSTGALQEWDYALTQNGGSIDEAVQFFEKLGVSRIKAMAGNEAMINSFQRLGISLADLKTTRVEDLGMTISKAFEAGDAQALIGDLKQLGGRGAGAMIAAFRDGMPELVEEARKSGQVMSEEAIVNLKELEDTGKKAWGTLRAEIGETVSAVWDFAKGAAEALRLVMAMGGGFIKGAFEGGTKGFKEGGILGAAKGYLTGGWKEATEAGQDYFHGSMEIADKEAERKAKAKNKGGPLDMEVENEKAKAKELREAERIEKEIARLKEETAKKVRQNALDEMTSQEKILALEQERAALKSGESGMTAEGQAKADLRVAEIDKEIWQAGKAETDQSKASRARPELNKLQQMGAFAASQDNPVLNVVQKQEKHLDNIRKNIDLIANRPATGAQY